MAVASLVLGIVSLIMFFTFVPPFILGGLAVLFGILGLSKANQGAPHKGLAIVGLVCGAVGIVAAILHRPRRDDRRCQHHASPSISPAGLI
jgi:hypothetical protein